MMEKKFAILAAAVTIFAGCGGQSDSQPFQYDHDVHVVSREEGSGTRGAFVELFGITEKNGAGETFDHTTLEADVTNNTAVMITTVANDRYAIGYISLGSLNDTVKAVSIDGVSPSTETVENGSYKASRPFIIATAGEPNPETADFIGFIQSTEGQAIISEAGYIPCAVNSTAYTSTNVSGAVVVAGSSSVTPVMEKLAEAYQAVSPNVSVTIPQNDSTTGINSTIDGICDIGMASRALKESELEKGLKPLTIANDGIAVIVNTANPTDNLTAQQIKEIFIGEQISWTLE